MSTPQERVNAAIQFFFRTALPAATGKQLSQLTSPMVHYGSYVRHTGVPVRTALREVPVVYDLKVSRTELPRTGQGGLPNAAGATVGSDAETRNLIWVRQVADLAVDDQAEIARVLVDLDSFAGLFDEAAASAPPQGTGTPPPPGTGTPPPGTGTPGSVPRAADWARILATPAVRTALSGNLSTLSEIPAPLSGLTTEVTDLKALLYHFFTFAETGEHYARWSGAGRDPANAAHLTDAYKLANVVEVQLERHQVYLYAVVPEALLASTHSDATQTPGTVFREVVVRFDETGDATIPFSLRTVHTARWLREAAPHEDFVFFYTEEGIGINAAPEVRAKLTAQMQSFLRSLMAAGDQRDTFLARNDHHISVVPGTPGTGATPASAAVSLVHVLATFNGTPTLPAGVIDSGGNRPTRSILVPLDKILDVAALAQVTSMTVPFPSAASNADARAQTRHADFVTTLPAEARGGVNVLIGVIDSGIDGSHRAFLDDAGATRIVAVWDNGPAAGLVAALTAAGRPAVSPAAAHPGNAAYAAFVTGVELTGADVAFSMDLDGHGTHVAGIAAGRDVVDPTNPANVLVPAGFAPKAKLAIVRMIDDGVPQDVDQAVLWIFQKAQELNYPCVINMSFGHTDHPHDGTDQQSENLLSHVTNAATHTFLPGRILVAAAGNDRAKYKHVRRAHVASGARQNIVVRLGRGERRARVTIWIKNPGTGAGPHAIDLSVTGRGLRRNTAVSTTPTVRFGGSTHADFPLHRTTIDINSSHHAGRSNDLEFVIDFTPSINAPTPGAMLEEPWTISLVNRTGRELDVHAWVARSRVSTTTFASSTEPDDDAFEVDWPAIGPAPISVAACVSKMAWTDSGGTARNDVVQRQIRELATFSSAGPLRFASHQPERFLYAPFIPSALPEMNALDVAAPGFRIQSAMSSQIIAQKTPSAADIITSPLPPAPAGTGSYLLQGTSQASPVITGLVANLLAANRNLTIPDVLLRLKNCSAIPPESNFQLNPSGGEPDGTPPGHHGNSRDWGYGLVNLRALLVP